MTESRIILIVIAVVLILIPVVLRAIQDADYKRQIKGKRPMRQLREHEIISAEKSFSTEVQTQLDKAKADIRVGSMQNTMGPH